MELWECLTPDSTKENPILRSPMITGNKLGCDLIVMSNELIGEFLGLLGGI